jgi:hypothetical protein
MSKLSKKNEKLEREENAALTAKISALPAKIEAHEKSFDESFAEIQSIRDHAKKIVKLRDLSNELLQARRAIDRERDQVFIEKSELINLRANRSTKTRRKTIARILGAIPTLAYTVVVAERVSQKSLREEEQKLNKLVDGAFEQVDIATFKKTVADNQARVTAMLDETVRACDLKEIAKSQYFPDALHNHEPLRKKFEAAAIARAALGEDDDQPKAAAAESPNKLRVQQSPVLRL